MVGFCGEFLLGCFFGGFYFCLFFLEEVEYISCKTVIVDIAGCTEDIINIT